jgi:hypothetical protein
MFERYNLPNHKGVRELGGCSKPDQNIRANEHLDGLRSCADDAANNSQRRPKYKEPSASKEIRQPANENLSN